MRKAILALSLVVAAAHAGARRPMGKVPGMTPTRTLVYKTVGDAKPQLHVFEPEGHKASDKRPAIVFFFGGGWTGGTPTQFFPQCKYLASRGMVAISAEYRVKSRHGVSPFECVTDGKSAIRWVRAHAAELGIAPERLAAGGGSAGGHVAACTGVIDGLDEKGEDAAVSSKPNALVLFNPVLVLDWEEFKKAGIPDERIRQLSDRFAGRDPKAVSPFHHVNAGDPPTIVFHGKADTTVPFPTAERFAEAMKKAGSRCELFGYDGQAHGFFNFGRGDAFYATLREADKFLVSLGYLQGADTLDDFRKSLSQTDQRR
ncbi:MAG TPA: alpha/beta hydrolase [Planctomycetota bacterium]|nr:alpha/beta hydrolase [Planctomycetota bacterium]